MVNTFLMDQVIDYIEAHPEEHDPKFWATRLTACGTTMCFAGHTVVLSGAKIQWRSSHDGYEFHNADECITEDGTVHQIVTYAQKLLGLTYKQADALFYCHNDLDDIKGICKAIANGEIS